jgi:hypothetical protein
MHGVRADPPPPPLPPPHQVNELINQELGPLVEDRSQYARNRERYLAESAAPRERRKWPEAKVPINLESLRNFNVRAKVVGPGVSWGPRGGEGGQKF